MGNVQMEARQIRYGSTNVEEALKTGGGGSTAASGVTYDNTDSHLTADNVQAAIDEMIVNFQDGVDDVYDACVAKGSTPASHSLSDVIAAIGNISGGGDTTLYRIVSKSIIGTDASITLSKYVNGTLISSTDYLYTQLQAPVTIDNTLVLQYGNLKWSYTLLKESLLLHPVDYVKSWDYNARVTVEEVFSA